ncbi:MAG: efflux transporter outer membrane subunit, partial [Verrucomicrobiota bacterium]
MPALLLTGCASFKLPDFEEAEIPVAERWLAVEASAEPFVPQWLDDFSNPQLKAVIEEALTNNYNLRAAAYRLEEVRALALKAGAERRPQVGAGLGAGRQKRSASGGLTLTEPEVSQYDFNVNLNWELDLWGRLKDRRDAATLALEQEENLLNDTRLSLVATTIRSWYNVVEHQRQVELARDVLASFESNLNTVEERYEAGLSTALDLRLTRANTAGARRSLQARQRQFDAAARALEILLGRYPARALEVEKEIPALKPQFTTGVPSVLLQRRPDLRAAARNVERLRKESRVAKKALLPSLRITGSYGSQSDTFGDVLDFNIWNIAANAAQPLLQGGRLKADILQARAALQRALAEYGRIALQAFLDVEQALAAEGYLK